MIACKEGQSLAVYLNKTRCVCGAHMPPKHQHTCLSQPEADSMYICGWHWLTPPQQLVTCWAHHSECTSSAGVKHVQDVQGDDCTFTAAAWAGQYPYLYIGGTGQKVHVCQLVPDQ